MPGIESVALALSVARQIAGIIVDLGTAARRNGDLGPAASKLNALEITLTEWINQARLKDPALPQPPIGNRAQYVIEQFDRLRYHTSAIKNPLSIPIGTQHSTISIEKDGRAVLLLGQSSATRPLLGMSASLDIKFPFAAEPASMPLPVFNVTMLGKSGAGKTVYMAAMYNRLVNGFGNIALRAMDPDIDLELRQIIEEIMLDRKWPLGTVSDQKEYNFELLVRGKPVAQINWIDYRGGDISDNQKPENVALIRKRIRDSHAVIWIVDMTAIQVRSITSEAARLQTKIGRYAALCRETTTEPKAWVFVRSKADLIRGSDGEPDYTRAVQELNEHLGDTAHTVVSMGAYSKGVLVPISATTSPEDNESDPGDSVNVHWPFLLALASLLEGELKRLSDHGTTLQQGRDNAAPQGFSGVFKRLLRLGSDNEDLQFVDTTSRILRELLRINDVISTILADVPKEQVIFLDPR